MKLNLWMVANRLHNLEPERHIPENAPADLQSARLAAIPHCVYVYQKGDDVICDAGAEGGFLVFHNALYAQIFDIIQGTFDYYQEWEQMLEEALANLDYESIIEKSWMLFHNPLVLVDGSNKVLAMSSQYGEDEVNNDWRYLKVHGHSSVNVIEYLMEEGKNNRYYLNRNAQIYYFAHKDIRTSMITYAMFWKDISYGRLNVIEYERELNAGDVKLVEVMSAYLSEILGRLAERADQTGALQHYFSRMLLGQEVSETEMTYWKQYIHWSSEKDYRICVIAMEGEEVPVQKLVMIRTMVQNSIPRSLAVINGRNIIFSLSDAQLKGLYADGVLDSLAQHEVFTAGLSLPYRDTAQMPYAYDQALQAIRFAEPGEGRLIADFYPAAIRYLIENSMQEAFVYACHPDILRLWQDKAAEKYKAAETYYQYLKNHRSVSQTARELDIHKNTLIYRIRRIEENFRYDDASTYTGEYMLLSMYILRLRKGVD